jgi:CubicO group peptidase (beta-lactamase class C family)
MLVQLDRHAGTMVSTVIVVTILLVGAAAPVSARPDEPAGTDLSDVGRTTDRLVPRLLHDGEIPGAAIAVVSHGKVVLAKGYGWASLRPRVAMRPDTDLYLGSTAKLFTAAAALQLAEAGKLDFDVDVNRYLRHVRIKNTYPGRPVTMRNLLTHTAGFDPDFGMVGTSANHPDGLPSLADALNAKQPARIHPPGTVLAYDNYGVALAGMVVEDISGLPYATYLRKRIFGPLRMAASTARQPHPAAIAASMATGYRPDGVDQIVTGASANPFTPAGPGQVSDAADMARFMVDQLSSHSRLGRGIPQQMQHPRFGQDRRIPTMGYIYEEHARNGIRIVAKDGDTSGFHSILYLLPATQTGFFIAVNGDGNGKVEPADVLDDLVDTYLPGTPPRSPKPMIPADVSSFAGTYQSSRVSHHSILKIRALTQSLVTVRASGPGTLTTSGRTLSSHPAATRQTWVEIGSRLFQETDGSARLAFDRHGILASSQATNQVYLKVAWYQNPALHLGMALAGFGGLTGGLLAIPLLAGIRRLRGQKAPAGPRPVRLFAWFAAVVASVGLISLALLMSSPAALPEKLFLGAPELLLAMAALTLVVPCAAVLCFCAVMAWVRGWWGVPGRMGYSLLAFCATSLSIVAVTYNFLGPPFD